MLDDSPIDTERERLEREAAALCARAGVEVRGTSLWSRRRRAALIVLEDGRRFEDESYQQAVVKLREALGLGFALD